MDKKDRMGDNPGQTASQNIASIYVLNNSHVETCTFPNLDTNGNIDGVYLNVLFATIMFAHQICDIRIHGNLGYR